MKQLIFYYSVCAVILLLSAISSNAQTIQWTNTYGGTSQDGGESMVLANDGGIIIAGFQSSGGQKGVLLMKTDASGNELWSRTFHPGFDDWGRDLKKTIDGGYIITGMTGPGNQTYDPFLIKTDGDGNVQWQHQYDYGFGADDRGHAVCQTSDGGYIIAGQTLLMHGSFANYDIYIVKTDVNGNVRWTKVFYREESGNDVALGIDQTSDGGYIIGGLTQSSSWASYIIRTDSLGNEVWSNIYPGAWQSECYDIHASPDGGFFYTGIETSFETDGDVLIARLDDDGVLLWKRIYGTADSEMGESIQRLQNGDYLIAGMSSHGSGGYDMYVMKTNSGGDSLWSRTIGGSGDDRAFCGVSEQDGTYFVTGWAWSYGLGQGDVYLVKLTESPSGIIENNSVPQSPELFQNYPNPFNPETTISFYMSERDHATLRIFDASGKEISILLSGVLDKGKHSFKWDASLQPSGIYFSRLETKGSLVTKKMMLVK